MTRSELGASPYNTVVGGERGQLTARGWGSASSSSASEKAENAFTDHYQASPVSNLEILGLLADTGPMPPEVTEEVSVTPGPQHLHAADAPIEVQNERKAEIEAMRAVYDEQIADARAKKQVVCAEIFEWHREAKALAMWAHGKEAHLVLMELANNVLDQYETPQNAKEKQP